MLVPKVVLRTALLRAKRVVTTGEAARLCGCSNTLVQRWMDKGKLRGYRLPDCGDRRIYVDSLVEFMRSRGMEVPPELLFWSKLVVLVAVRPDIVERIREVLGGHYYIDPYFSIVSGLSAVATMRPPVVIVGDGAGTDELRSFPSSVRQMSSTLYRPIFIAMVDDSRSSEDFSKYGYVRVFSDPSGMAEFFGYVRSLSEVDESELLKGEGV